MVKKIAIITINHNHGEMIRRTIESIVQFPCENKYKLFVINNVDDQQTKSWIKNTLPKVELIENQQPKGFASNVNQVISQNPAFDFYLLLNPDVICLPGMVDGLLDVMQKDDKIGAAGPKLLNMDGSIQPSRRRFASFSVLVLRALHIDKIISNLPAVENYLMNGSTFTGVEEVDWITGAVMILRKSALDQVGLMDERFYMYFEDEDLCCRMWQRGWKVCYISNIEAFHAHIAAGRNKLFSKANFQHILSAVKMLIKYKGKITECYDRQRLNKPMFSGKTRKS